MLAPLSTRAWCEGALEGLEEDKDWFTMDRIGAWDLASKEVSVKPRATTGTSKAAASATGGLKRRVVRFV